MPKKISSTLAILLSGAILALSGISRADENLEALIQLEIETTVDGAKSQQVVSRLSEETREAFVESSQHKETNATAVSWLKRLPPV